MGGMAGLRDRVAAVMGAQALHGSGNLGEFVIGCAEGNVDILLSGQCMPEGGELGGSPALQGGAECVRVIAAAAQLQIPCHVWLTVDL